MRSDTSTRIAAVAFILFAGFWACRSTKQNLNKPIESPPPTAPVSQSPFDVVDSKVIGVVSPFDHNRKEHKAKTQDCSACHARSSNDPVPMWPGHSACFDCHVKDKTNLESKMCIVCHKIPVDTQGTRIAFPSKLVQFGLKRFSHRDHANPEKMKGQMDADKMPEGAPRCDFCHRFDNQGLKASMPKHPECYACHAHQPNEKFAACGACHINKPNAMQYGATLGTAFSLYNFRHGPHLKTAACDRCHKSVEVPADQPRTDILKINVDRGQRHHSTCWTCHVQAKEPVCSKCHVSGTPF
jgi:decaheme cytochrome c component MtrC/MtrF-like protein